MATDPFQKLDQYLRVDCSGNEWHEERAAEAQRIAAGFERGDWSLLNEQWRSRPSGWLFRCICSLRSLGQSGSPAAPVLLDMLMVPDNRIGLAAVDSLRAIDWTRIAPSHTTPQVFARLQELADGGSRADKDVIEQFVLRLKAAGHGE
jgi:hypothetical protein